MYLIFRKNEDGGCQKMHITVKQGIYEKVKRAIEQMAGDKSSEFKVCVEDTRGTLGGILIKIEDVKNQEISGFRINEDDVDEAEHMTRYSVDKMLQRRKTEGIVRLKEIESALGIKFEKWQKEYILSRGLGYPIEGRNTGRTLAHQVKTLMKSEDDIIIYPHQRWMYPDVPAGMKNTEYYAKCYVKELRELSEKLRNHGINVPRVIEVQGDGMR